MFRIYSGPISSHLSPAVHATVYDLLRRAGIDVTPDDKAGKIISKGSERIWTCSDVTRGEDFPIFSWSPASRGNSLICEMERIFFASGGHDDGIPNEEIFVSVGHEADFLDLDARLRASLDVRDIFSGNASTCRLPGGVTLHRGPAADPRTGEARSYVALQYRVFSLHFARRSLMLRRIRTIFRECGLARLSSRNFLGRTVPEHPWRLPVNFMYVLPEALGTSLHALLLRADIAVAVNQQSESSMQLSKGSDRIAASVTRLCRTCFAGRYIVDNLARRSRVSDAVAPFNPFAWAPAAPSSISSLHRELARMIFASGTRGIRNPSAEIYASACKEVDFADLKAQLREALNFQRSSSGNAGSSQLPFEVIFHWGPAVDPKSGEPHSYVALDYARFSRHCVLRGRMLRQIRKILREGGFSRKG